eukprot:scaffold339708_cov34-Prasinocladus_malaysianus.AAC.2
MECIIYGHRARLSIHLHHVVQIVWGIAGVESIGSAEGLFSTSTGAAILDSSASLSSEAAQLWVLHVCDTLKAREDLVEEEIRCVARDLKWWGETHLGSWPIPQANFSSAVVDLLT